MMRNWNDAVLVSVAILMIVSHLPSYIECGIRCYKCSMTIPSPLSNEPQRLCNNFDYTDRFIVDCPYSTFCMKKDFTVNLAVPVNGTIRDCASQRYDYHEYKDGKWSMQVSVEEPYEEGCTKTNDKGWRSSISQHCYCKGELCNGTDRIAVNQRLLLINVLSVILMLYVNPDR